MSQTKRCHLYSKSRSFKISEQAHITRQQYPIYWKWYQHTRSEGMEWYWQAIDYKEVRSIWQDKMEFLPSSSCIDTAIWIPNMDAYKEKVWMISVAFWLMNACCSNKKTNHDMWGNRVIFTGKSIYKRETIRWEHRISD